MLIIRKPGNVVRFCAAYLEARLEKRHLESERNSKIPQIKFIK